MQWKVDWWRGGDKMPNFFLMAVWVEIVLARVETVWAEVEAVWEGEATGSYMHEEGKG